MPFEDAESNSSFQQVQHPILTSKNGGITKQGTQKLTFQLFPLPTSLLILK